MPNAKDASTGAYQRILACGRGGSGKTSQIWTLPGRKFAYLFDPAALASLSGLDIDYEQFIPDAGDLDASLKGFNKGSKDDKVKGPAREPKVYVNWVEHFNTAYEQGFFADYDWLILDSYTMMQAAMMDRIMWLNNRLGGIEDLSDYRVSGTKLTEISRTIFSMPINIYATCHLNTYQDEKTKKLETQINIQGKGRVMIPLLCSNIWELRASTDDKSARVMLTRPEPRGFADIRSSIKDLKPVEDVDIKNWKQPEAYGIGAILKKAGFVPTNSQKPKSVAEVPVAEKSIVGATAKA